MTSDMATTCPLCGSPARLLYRGNTDPRIFFTSQKKYAIAEGSRRDVLDIYQCGTCGVGFSPADITESELYEFYRCQPEDIRYCVEERGRRVTFQRVLKKIEARYPKKGKLFDYGAGPALFLDEARGRGWAVFGSEASAWAREYAEKKFGIGLYTRDEFEKLPDGMFDVVTVFDVLEHVLSPVEFLRRMLRLLKPGGMLVITTPRFESWSRRLWGRRWGFIFPAHLWYFTHDSLSLLFRQAGCEESVFTYHVFHFSLAYLVSRLLETLPWLSRFSSAVKGNYLCTVQIPFSTGEEWEVFAQKPIQ